MAVSGSRNPKEQRRDNAYNILNIIRMSEDDVSRKILNEQTGLSFPSVNDIVNYLMEFNLITSFEGEGASRKKVPCYRFSGESYRVLGLTIIPRKAIGICSDLNGIVLSRFEVDYNGDINSFLSEIVLSFKTTLERKGQQDKTTLAMGISCPGLIDFKRKRVIYSDNFPELEDIDLAERFESGLGVPVFVEHNSNLSAFAARKLGNAKKLNNFIYIILDRGIGGSLIYDGKLFRGDSPFIGELGHSTVVIDGDECTCGNRGCLELYAGSDVVDSLMDRCEKEEEKEMLLRGTAEKIGMAIGNLICFLGVRNVVFGGRTIKKYPDLFYQIRHVLLSRTLPEFRPVLDIRKSGLDDMASPLGAALWVGEIALSNQSSFFFGNGAPELPLKLDMVIKDSI